MAEMRSAEQARKLLGDLDALKAKAIEELLKEKQSIDDTLARMGYVHKRARKPKEVKAKI